MNVKKGSLKIGVVVAWTLSAVGLTNGILWLRQLTGLNRELRSSVDNPLLLLDPLAWMLTVIFSAYTSLCIEVGVWLVLLTIAVVALALLIYVVRGFIDSRGRLIERQQRAINELKHCLSDYQRSGIPSPSDRVQNPRL